MTKYLLAALALALALAAAQEFAAPVLKVSAAISAVNSK